MKKKIYLSGKITDLPMEEVQKKFQCAEDHFVSMGYEVVNPLKLEHNHDKSWTSYMMVCLNALIQCDAIVLLHDYYKSHGAMVEHLFSRKMDKEILHFDLRVFKE